MANVFYPSAVYQTKLDRIVVFVAGTARDCPPVRQVLQRVKMGVGGSGNTVDLNYNGKVLWQ